MARAGRKRRQGNREKNGRIQRTPDLRYDKGTERAQAMQALYGTDGCDAIGRAFRAGLLGEGNEAKAKLDTARRLANAYWRAFETGRIVSAIADKTSGSLVDLDHEKIRRQELWLTGALKSIDRMGPSVRRAFNQLVIDVHPDHGPAWLDSLCWTARQNIGRDKKDYWPFDPVDEMQLSKALSALEMLAA